MRGFAPLAGGGREAWWRTVLAADVGLASGMLAGGSVDWDVYSMGGLQHMTELSVQRGGTIALVLDLGSGMCLRCSLHRPDSRPLALFVLRIKFLFPKQADDRS